MAQESVSIDFGGGKVLTLQTGKFAKLCDATVVATLADTTVLNSIIGAPPRPNTDFFPLTVDYRERPSAAGKFPGGFIKREGRPSTKETLTMRMIDRPIRPLFPDGYYNEILVQSLVLSFDQQNDSDVLAINGASAAMSLSGQPFMGPLGAVRVGRVKGKFVLFPTLDELEESDFDLLLAGHEKAVSMIEIGAKQVKEEVLLEAIQFGHEAIKKICTAIADLKQRSGKPITWVAPGKPEVFIKQIHAKSYDRFRQAKLTIKSKTERNDACAQVYRDLLAEYTPNEDSVITGPSIAPLEKLDRDGLKKIISAIEEHVTRELIWKDGVRPDGRKPDELRQIISEPGILPRVHGSALFSRGETQALVTTTLGTGDDEQIIDGLTEEYSQNFMLHYNFPPLATGEIKRITGVSRREIGHGALAERSLAGVIPDKEEFGYTVRVVSDILESNGSSSMATVCGATLSLMDAGVKIKAPVAGISIGMITPNQDTEDHYVLLTDILGEEDHFGDMDFKIAGTQTGVTGVQLDLKRHGLSHSIIVEVFERARQVRLKILENMLAALPAPRSEISKWAPRMLMTKIDPEKIGKVIGPGGKTIKDIQARTGASIDIEDDGTVRIASVDAAMAQQALEEVEAIGAEIKVGKVYTGPITGIREFGAFVEIAPGTDGLCHVSELSDQFVKNVHDVVKMGDVLKVKVILIDDQGRIKLSRKAVLKEEAQAAGNAPAEEKKA